MKGEGSIDISHGQCEPLTLLLLLLLLLLPLPLLSGMVVAVADSCRRSNC